MSAQKWSFCEIYIKKWSDCEFSHNNIYLNAVAEYKGDAKDLIGYQRITGHLIFDVKLGENFRRKARFVADGHKTKTHLQLHTARLCHATR